MIWLCIIVRGESSSEGRDNLDRRWICHTLNFYIMVISQLPDVSWWLSCSVIINVKYLASSRLFIVFIVSSIPFVLRSSSRSKIYNLPAFFSFIRRIWHTPRGGIHDVVRDVSAKRLAYQVVYSRFYTNLHKKVLLSHSYLSSILKFLLFRVSTT